MGELPHRGVVAIIAAFATLAACASPVVDTSAPTFDETQYMVDLDNCQGGTVIDVALHGLGGAAIGSIIGLAQGAWTGAFTGSLPEGAAIGAVVGGVVGIFVGAYEPIQEQERSVRQCLSEKGYSMES